MATLPPFRTRRNEPILSFDDQDDDVPLTRALADDDVPVLTQVIDEPPPLTWTDEPATSATDGVDEVLLDTLTDRVLDQIQPQLRDLIRDALADALRATPRP